MKYIFSADLENVCIEVVDDSDFTERRVAILWSKAEFYQLTGILVPDNVESLSLEPDRNIFAVRYQGEDSGTMFTNQQDAPQFMRDIWNQRAAIRMHLKATIMERRDTDGYLYHYDEQLDQIVQTEHPDREHLVAVGELNRYKIAARIVVDLVDLLVQKGVITEGELPSYFDLTTAKDILSKIDWSKV